MKSAWVFLADGFEDIEAVYPVDILRRAGVEVTVVGVTGPGAVSSHGLGVACDLALVDIEASPLPDCVVFPGGGPGSRNLAASAGAKRIALRMFADNRLVGAICAAPAVALGAWGLLAGRSYTCFPGSDKNLTDKSSGKRVEIDGNLVTAQAAGVAEEFALALVEKLCGKDAERKVALEIVAR
jgi:4-methyl-5(b-hydroxyethyl)-thiazole monophosphate biosynthesis